jgi:hypothetical protein
MQGLEHIEDVVIGFIPALLDGFGDELIEGRLLQLALLQEFFKKTVAARLRLDATVVHQTVNVCCPKTTCSTISASNGISVPQASPASSANPATYSVAPRRLHREAERKASG